MDENKKIEIVSGDGSELNISEVRNHLHGTKPKSATEKPTNIVIPKETNKTSDNKDNEENEKKEEEN